MEQKTYYKNGKTATVNISQEKYYLDAGWGVDAPKAESEQTYKPQDSPQKKYYYKEGDEVKVYDRETDTHVTEEQASAIPDFWSKVEPYKYPTDTPKPAVDTTKAKQSFYELNKGDPEVTAFGNIGETDPTKRYIKYSDSNIVYDKKTMHEVSAEQAASVPDFWDQVDYSEIIPETLTDEVTERIGYYGEDASKIFVKYANSLHVFEKSGGRYISADEASSIHNFWENTEFNDGAKPDELIKPLKPVDTDLAGSVNDEINGFSDFVSNIVSEATDEADPFSTDEVKPKTTEEYITSLESLQDDKTAEEIYTELFNSQEMQDAKTKLAGAVDELQMYDDQLDELKDDIRNEVEGEASASYISALTSIRGEKIMKLKRLAQREYDQAYGELKDLKTQATNIANARMKDSDTRYNRMFQMLQLQFQQEGVEFNQGVALANIAMQLPEGRSIGMPNGDVVKGMKETDDLNIVQFTDASRNVYIIAVDKKTGEEKYRKLLGKAPAAAGSALKIDATPSVTLLKERTAAEQLAIMDKVKSKVYAMGSDSEGSFYYNKAEYEAAHKKTSWNFNPWDNVTERDFMTVLLK